MVPPIIALQAKLSIEILPSGEVEKTFIVEKIKRAEGVIQNGESASDAEKEMIEENVGKPVFDILVGTNNSSSSTSSTTKFNSKYTIEGRVKCPDQGISTSPKIFTKGAERLNPEYGFTARKATTSNGERIFVEIEKKETKNKADDKKITDETKRNDDKTPFMEATNVRITTSEIREMIKQGALKSNTSIIAEVTVDNRSFYLEASNPQRKETAAISNLVIQSSLPPPAPSLSSLSSFPPPLPPLPNAFSSSSRQC